jgi:hypothetical protein
MEITTIYVKSNKNNVIIQNLHKDQEINLLMLINNVELKIWRIVYNKACYLPSDFI